MYRKTFGFAAVATLIAMPTLGQAQFLFPNTTTAPTTSPPVTAFTFTMQVNLTQLSTDLEKVGLMCAINPSTVFKMPAPSTMQGMIEVMAKDYLPVVAGQVVGTLRAVFPIPAEWLVNPIGQPGDYTCMLLGLSRSEQKWGAFSETSTIPALLLKPAPQQITGTFKW